MTHAMDERLRGMPEAVEDHAWATAARLARGMAGRRFPNGPPPDRDRLGLYVAGPVPRDEVEKLCLAVYRLTYFRRQPWTLPERHRTDVMTVRDWVQTLLPSGHYCSTDIISPLDAALTQAGTR
jgi:hypothetical protein